MQLSSSPQIPDGLLAAMTLLSEKPRLGFGHAESTVHQGLKAANSLNRVRDTTTLVSYSWQVSLMAQQQIGQDPTLPTAVAPPPPNVVDRLMDAIFPKTWGDMASLALMVPTDGLGELGAAAPRLMEESVSVYQKAETAYVGISKNLAAREAQHGEKLTEVVGGLTRKEAKGVEQAIIEHKGLSNLTNKINSIAKANPIYQESVKFGKQVLQSIGFK